MTLHVAGRRLGVRDLANYDFESPLGGRLCVTTLIGSEEEEETISTIFIVLESERNILEV